MKFLGQHIQQFIARFRDDVYLENIANPDSDTDKFLVASSDGKVGFRTGTNLQSDLGVTPGTDVVNQVTITSDSGAGARSAQTGQPAYSFLGGDGISLTNSTSTFTVAVDFTDDEQATFGTGNDLKIYHNSSLSRNLIDSDVGDLYINQNADDKDIVFRCDDGSGGITAYLTLDGSTTHSYFSAGNVGIGITNPTSKFHVVGDARIQGNLTVNGTYTQIDTDVSTTEQWLVTNDGTGPAAIINQKGSEDIFDVQDDGTSVFYIEDGGQIGMGVTSPSQKLHVNGNIRVGNSTDAFYGNRFTALANADVELRSNNGYDLILNANSGDNVGIGTTSPAEKLTLKATSSSEAILGAQYSSTTTNFFEVGVSSHDSYLTLKNSGVTEVIKLNSDGNSYLNGGNVGIGTTSPISRTEINQQLSASSTIDYPLTISSRDDNNSIDQLGGEGVGIKFRIAGNDASAFGNSLVGASIAAIRQSSSDTNSSTDLGFFVTQNDEILDESIRIKSDGNVGIGTTSPGNKLEVHSGTTNVAGVFKSSDNQAWISVQDDDSGTYGALFGTDSDAGHHIVLADRSANKRLVVDSSGNVGIGTASPSEKLEVDGNIKIGDNDVVKIGDGNDFTATHDGTDTFLGNNTGNLYITQQANDKDIIFRSDDGSGGVETYFFLDGSANTSGSPKTIFPDNSHLALGNSGDFFMYHDGTNTIFDNLTGNITIQNKSDDKDIIFKSDDGSGGVTTYLTVDGSHTETVFSESARFADSKEARFGTSSDLKIYHNGSNSYVEQSGTGNLYIMNTTNDKDIIFVSDDGSGGTTSYLTLDGSLGYTVAKKQFLLDDNVQLSVGTSEHGINMIHDGSNSTMSNAIGNLTIVNYQNDGDIIFSSDDGSGGTTSYLTLDGSAGYTTAQKNIQFVDNAQAYFGTGVDLRIYHDGSNSYIKQAGTGDLYIQQTVDDKDIIFQSDDGSGGVETYFYLDGSTGYVQFPDSKQLAFGSDNDMRVYSSGSTNFIISDVGDLSIQQKANDKDIIFKCDDGSGGTTAYLTLDGSTTHSYFSAGNVGIGTTSPSQGLHVVDAGVIVSEFESSDNPSSLIEVSNNAGVDAFFGVAGGNLVLKHDDYTANHFSMTSAGNVGIGTTSPAYNLDVQTSSNIIARFESTDNKGAIAVKDDDTTAYISAENSRIGFGTSSALSTQNITMLTGNNYVGIGVTSPVEKLDVDGSIKLSGDIELGHASDTTIARASAGKVTIEGAPVQTTQMVVTHHHFFMNSSSTTADFFFPYNNLNEASSTSQYYTRTIAPYDGKIVKVLVRPSAGIGTACKLQFHKITDTTLDFGTAVEEVTNVNLNTAETSVSTAFSSATFSAGDVVNVSLIKSDSATANVQAVIVWEYTV